MKKNRKLFYFIRFIFYNIFSFIFFLFKIIINIFVLPCKNDADDIVAIYFWQICLPDCIHFTVYFDEKNKNIDNDFDTKIKVSKKEFNKLLESIKKEKILKHKYYALENPFISFDEYMGYFDIDGGPGDQFMTFYFKNGKKKSIRGYSKKIDKFKATLKEITSDEVFFL